MTDLLTRLLALAELAVDEALQYEYGDPEDRHIWRELQELKPLVQQALAQPEPEGPTDEELLRTYGLAKRDHCYEGPIDDWPNRAERAATVHGLRAVLARWGRPAIEPVPVSERLPGPEDCDAEGRCWWWIVDQPGEFPHWIYAPIEAQSWAGYSAWLPHHALPVPAPANEGT
jgi:hypothetical protein